MPLDITYYDGGGAAAAALIGLLVLLVLIPFIAVGYVLGSLFYMKIFEKAGVQGKWRAWVPVYNTMIFAKLGDLNPWWLLVLWVAYAVLSWVPVLNWIIGIAAFVYTLLAAWRVGLKLQKEAVWLILYFFLAIVWLGIAAFDRSRWNLVVPAAPWANSFLRDTTVWQGIPVQTPAGGYPANPVTQPGYVTQPPPPAAPEAPAAAPTPPPAPPAAPAAPATPPPAPRADDDDNPPAPRI